MDSRGDCILRTKDGTQFKASRVILGYASSVFGDMFGLPGPQDQIPIIDVEEDPETLQALLLLLYPQAPPTIASYDLAAKLINACDKYFIDVLRLRAFLYRVLSSPAALKLHPMGVYALCWRLKMQAEVNTAVRYTHTVDLSDPITKANVIRQSGSPNAILALWELRLQRELAIERLIHMIGPRRVFGCSERDHGRDILVRGSMVPNRWRELRSVLRTALNTPFPDYGIIREVIGGLFVATEESCNHCKAVIRQHEKQIYDTLANFPDTIPG